jgi:predicted nucleic acid-binding protein
MVARTEAYVDTSALIAFVDGSDTFHSLFRNLFSSPPQLYTTSLVISEGHAWFLRRFDQSRALSFLALIEQMPMLKILSVGEKELTQAAQVLRRYSDQKLTMTDAVGLQMMSARKTRSCWSTDFHLSITGVPLAIHS